MKPRSNQLMKKLMRINLSYLRETQHPCVALCCNTKYCGECISKWLATSKQCPFCRTSITNKSLVYIQDTEGEIEEKKINSN